MTHNPPTASPSSSFLQIFIHPVLSYPLAPHGMYFCLIHCFFIPLSFTYHFSLFPSHSFCISSFHLRRFKLLFSSPSHSSFLWIHPSFTYFLVHVPSIPPPLFPSPQFLFQSPSLSPCSLLLFNILRPPSHLSPCPGKSRERADGGARKPLASTYFVKRTLHSLLHFQTSW